jgi:hypothetical protein
MTMPRYIIVLAVLLASVPVDAFAQDGRRGTAQQQKACRADVSRFCRAAMQGSDTQIAECLRNNKERLSKACRDVMQ